MRHGGLTKTEQAAKSAGKFVGFVVGLLIFTSVAYYISGRVGWHTPSWHNYQRVLLAVVGLKVFVTAVRSLK